MIYLDNNATTLLDERVFDAMKPFFTNYFGNPSSNHVAGWQAKLALKNARISIAQSINTHHEEEIIFTSGATESINLALRGFWEQYGSKNNSIAVSPTEHKAVLDTISALQLQGATIHWLNVDKNGSVDLIHLESLLKQGVQFVCVMSANNETGLIQPISQIGALAREYGAFFMCDITQSVGKYPIDVQQSNIDLACASIHKCYGPKGVGFLAVNRKKPRISLVPQLTGGGHEFGLRAGTSNVPLIVGMQKAIELAHQEMNETEEHIKFLKKILIEQLVGSGFFEETISKDTNQLYNTVHVQAKVAAKFLIGQLAGRLCFSAGSACSSALPEPSHVLKAMGMSHEQAWHCIRLSLGKFNQLSEMNLAANQLIEAAKKQIQ